MHTGQLQIFISAITAQVLAAGELAISSQGKVANLKKTVVINDHDSQRIIEQRQAKTEIDEKVQEILLTSIYQTLGPQEIKIDAEEDTPSKNLFTDLNPSVTIVIDPIDGTLEYLNGSDEYSINLGLIENGQVLLALIYFPKWKKLYYLAENKKSYEVTYDQKLIIQSKKELIKPQALQTNSIYTNHRVPEIVIKNLRKIGMRVVEDDGQVSWPQSLLKCLSGEFRASIFHTPHTRDILLGALVKSLPDGFMVNWQSKAIPWPNGGRIPRVIFGVGQLTSEIFNCLA